MGGGGTESVQIRKNGNPNWAQLQQMLSSSTKHRRRPQPTIPAPAAPEPLPGKGREMDDDQYQKTASILTPTSDDCSATDELAMDCEMVGVGIDGRKNALGRVTLVNTWGNVVYDEYVCPLERVVDFRTEFSGIRPKNLKKAKEFLVVQKKVSDLLKGRILVGHALHNDLKVLMLTHPKKDIRDTAQYQPFKLKGRRRALRHLASQILNISIQQHEHCSIEDARSAMLIYQKHKRGWEGSLKAKRHLREQHGKHGVSKKRKKDNNNNIFVNPNDISKI
ncbi:RNA exonuclease [Zostera marina]|uniref:RNA exonuclease 4 n=1 Tax=Zostera marina TaxID=29655 RepID=A0A0K9P2E6_ZOSMR|nr:RNA exonuclease [Zostera marina]